LVMCCLVLCAGLLALPSIGSAAALPGAAWSVSLPAEGEGTLVAAPGDAVLAASCTNVASNGNVLWQLPNVMGRPPSCAYEVGDSEGNTYVLDEQASGGPVVESLNSSGAVRWATPTDGFTSWRAEPVLGGNGSVFFSMGKGTYSKVVGYNEQTGAVTFEHTFGDVTGLHAYSGGIIVVDTDSRVDYLGYDGAVLAEYTTGPPISAYEAYSNSAGADGTLFVAGYSGAPGACGSESHASVEKFTPAGLAWTWTDPEAYCSQTMLAATPDGGVILARSKSNPSADFTSLSASGTERWTDVMQGPLGPAEEAAYFPVRVDVNGVVVLPARIRYHCPVGLSEQCPGTQIEFVSEQTDGAVFTPMQITDSGEYGFTLFGDAIDSERLYVTGTGEEHSTVPVLSAFSIPGLGMDYQLALQKALTEKPSPPTSTGNGESPSNSGSSPPLTPEPSDYVALGDSYSAGQGNPPYLAGTDTKHDPCHRSTAGYPFQTSLTLGFFAPQFNFHACSGAVIPDFFHGRNDELPQLSWLSDADTLVTLTIGGNDAYFAKVMETCVFASDCELIWKHKVNAAITAMAHYSPTNTESLQRLYMMIAAKAPRAKIVVLGYPRFFPVDPPLLCPSEVGPLLGKGTMLWINSEIKHMDGVIKAAVSAANRAYPRIVYADAYNAFTGHEICTSRPDMYGVRKPFNSKERGGSFHPNRVGQRVLAAIVQTAAK
jgi:hypothetical protein